MLLHSSSILHNPILNYLTFTMEVDAETFFQKSCCSQQHTSPWCGVHIIDWSVTNSAYQVVELSQNDRVKTASYEAAAYFNISKTDVLCCANFLLTLEDAIFTGSNKAYCSPLHFLNTYNTPDCQKMEPLLRISFTAGSWPKLSVSKI